jgi:L-2-hydroxyglutarate oxidase
MSFHILNYNSPGATGALSFSAYVIDYLNKQGMFVSESSDAQCGPWKFSDIIEKLAL